MASLTGNLVAETYKALLKTIDNDILTASEKQITDGLGGGSNVFIDSNGFLRANKYKVTNGLATQFLKADGSLDANTYLTSITGAQVITALGYTPVTDQRTLTINGVTYNLTANRSWTVAGTAAVWGNITGTLSDQTDLQNALNAKYDDPTGTISQYIRGDGSIANFPAVTGFVPYTGATQSVNLGAFDLFVNELTVGKGTNSLSNNTALGHQALFHISTGNYNTGVGHESLHNTTTGAYNTGIGQSSLFTNTTGSYNSAFGLNALLSNTTGQSNVAVGLDSLNHNTTGNSNIGVGYNAGSHITDGTTPNTTGANSIFIGRDTRANANAQTNQIVIGHTTIGNGSNTVTIGNSSITANYFQGSINAGSFVKSGGTSSQFLKADGTIDTSTYLTTADATSTYQRLDRMAINLLASDIQYPNNNAVIAALALKANAANPVFTGNMTISGAEPKLFFTDTDNNPDYTVFIDSGVFYIYDQTAGTTRFSIGSTGNISAGVGKSITADSFIKDGGTASQFLKADGTIDSNTYVASSALANYLLISTAASTYQRLDNMAINLLASDTQYPNNNAVIAALALKANAANPVFTGNMSISGAEPKLFFVDTDNNPDYTVFIDSGVFFIYDQTVGTTRFSINSSGNISTGVGKSITAGSFIRDGGTASQFLMADGSVTTLSGVVTGSGTTNYLPKWTSGSAIGNSIISNNGTIVSVAGNLQSARFYNTFVNAGNNSRNSFQSFNLNEASLTAGWIAADFGDLGTTSNRVVFGSGYGGKAIIGGHTGLLDNWASLLINPFGSGNVIIGGQTDAGYKLDVNGQIRSISANSLVLSQSSVAANDAILAARWSNTSGIEIRYNPDNALTNIDSLYSATSGQVFGDVRFRVNSGGTMTPVMTIKSNVLAVGIGTISPEQKLHVEGNIQIGNQGNFAWAYGNGNYYNFITNTYNQTDGLTFRSGSWTGNTDMICYSFETYLGSYQKRLVINQNGSIGVGITNPRARFVVQSATNYETSSLGSASANTFTLLSSNGLYGMTMGVANSGNTWLQSQRTDGGTAAYNLVLNPQGGNVLVGTVTDSGYKLYVYGNSAIDTGSFKGIFGSIGSSWGGSTNYPTIYGSAADRWVMHINPHISYTQNGVNGFTGSMTGATLRMASDPAATNYWDIGIGVCSVGSDKFAIGRNATALFTITNTGNVTATAFFESSDIRLKTLIETNPIVDGIEKLEAKLYEKEGKIEMGYFAQDAELIMPYAVQKNHNGFLNLSYREVHTAKIARLEKEVAELKEKLNVA